MLASDEFQDPVTVEVTAIQQDKTPYRCTISDGGQSCKGVFASQLTELVDTKALAENTLVKLIKYAINATSTNQKVLLVTDLEVVDTPTSREVNPDCDARPTKMLKTEPEIELSLGSVCEVKADLKPEPPAVPSTGPQTPSTKSKEGEFSFTPEVSKPIAKENVAPATTPCPTPSPEIKVSFSMTPKTDGKHTPGAAIGPLSKIAALHPYDDQWVIKAKVSRKYPLRSFTRNGNDNKVMTIELIDDQGSQIQATFWRQAVDKYADVILEGKVFVFSRFQVKPANKQYSNVKNDYEMHLDNRTEIKECEDQGDAASMTAAVEITRIDNLTKYLGRKIPVDVMGVVVGTSSLDTIKRKADGAEMMRRDVTLADTSNCSVTVTLWQDNATSLPVDLEGSVVLATCCRVTDFKGLSLSTLTRSTVSVNPEMPEAAELQQWYQGLAGSYNFTSVGAAMEAGRGSGQNGGQNSNALKRLSELDVPVDQMPPPDAKPKYATVMASVAHVNPDQTLYYLANPETGRKVVEQSGRFCEADGKMVDAAENRYVLNLKAIDSSGEAYLSLFNKEAEEVLGVKANDMATYKSAGNVAAYNAALKASQWNEWVMTVSSKSREYNGDMRMRHTVVNVRPINYLVDGQRLLDLIKQYDSVL